MDAGLTLGNAGDIAFTLSNVEVSVLQPGRTRGDFIPVATLLPGSELLGGDPAVFNLLPLEERGPIIFSNREVFPNLVEDLMRAPRGLIFKVTYFDVTDEFGRNLAYITQDVFERTAVLTIDPGDGTFKRYYVATCGGMDTEGYAGGGLVGGFDEHGVARGIPMDFVLQDILGLVKNPDTPNAIVAGYNGVADTVAEAGDIQAVPPGTAGLPDRTVVVLAGQNGLLDTLPNNVNPLGDDRVAFTTGYDTSLTCDAHTAPRIIEPELDHAELGGDRIASTEAEGDDVQEVPVGDPVNPGEMVVSAGPNGLLETVARGDDVYAGPGDLCDCQDDCPGGSCAGNEAIMRFENSATGDPNRFWVVFSSAEIPIGTDFGDFLLMPDEAITLAFGQDIDRDGLFAREEFIYGSSDRMKDTDEDELGDFAEIRVGWKVKVAGRADAQVYPAPALEDSDFDDLRDDVEKQCRTDPRTRDTDGDGLTDSEEIAFGRCCSDADGTNCASNPALPCNDTITCTICVGGDNDGQRCRLDEDDDCPGGTCQDDSTYPVCFADLTEVCQDSDFQDMPYPPERLDPRNPDTDGDSVPDSLELTLGSNPLDPHDADRYRDTDLDGLTDQEEREGWPVTVRVCDQPNCRGGAGYDWCEQRGCIWQEAQNLVQNGEFEENAEGWELGTGEPHYYFRRMNGPGWNEEPGYFALNDYGPQNGARTWISQEITGLVAGETYVVSGYFRSGAGWSGGPSFQVKINNVERFAGGYNRVADWMPFGFEFVAARTHATLEIRGEVGSNSDYDVDGIRVVRQRDAYDTCLCTGFPDPTEGDSDFDGLPDYLERELGTDPQDDDTDGDGILDYDEFAEFKAYMNLANVYPGFYLSGSGSQQLGTDPTSQDTDGDRLPDNFELYDGWRVLTCTDDAPREVMSDSLWSDSDLDGLTDLQEYLGANGIPPADDGADYDATDPTDPDTDGDGHLDKGETFPLGCGKLVSVMFHAYYVGTNACDPGADEGDWTMEFTALFNQVEIGKWEVTEDRCAGIWYVGTCASYPVCDGVCQLIRSAVQPIKWAVGPFEMRPGDQIHFGGTVAEWELPHGKSPYTVNRWDITEVVRTFDTVTNEFFDITPMGDSDPCFNTGHRIKVQLSIVP